MTWSAEIKSYRLYISGARSNVSGWTRFVQLFDSDGTQRGYIQFQYNVTTLPHAFEYDVGNTGKKAVSFYMHEHSYSDVVDLLRNEKPLYLLYYNPHAVYVATSENEPVGEGPEPSS